MSAALGVAGWLLAAASLCAAVTLRGRLDRHIDAVARACHELRGPLTAARLGLELGARIRQMPSGRLRGIELELGRAALALDDLAASWAGQRGVAAERVDVAELVDDSAEAWGVVAAAHGVRLLVDRSREHLVVHGERLRLAQAVGNLIANAIEHGGGVVEVRRRVARGVIRIEVADTGPGLAAPIEELARSHGWGRRGASRAARGHGLAVARSVAAAHGGRLTTAPSERGARVVLELPAARAPVPVQAVPV